MRMGKDQLNHEAKPAGLDVLSHLTNPCELNLFCYSIRWFQRLYQAPRTLQTTSKSTVILEKGLGWDE